MVCDDTIKIEVIEIYKLIFFVGENIDDLKFSTIFNGCMGGRGWERDLGRERITNKTWGYNHVKNKLMKKEPEAELFSKSLVSFVHLINDWFYKFEDALG